MIEIRNRKMTAKIDEFGAELKSLVFGETEYIWEGIEGIWTGSSPILFPICGGLKEDRYFYNGKEYTLKKHGFARKTLFEVEEKSDNYAVFLHKSDKTTKAVFPFDYELRIIYTLIDNTLRVDYSVLNKSENEMYFSIGSHDAFKTPEGIENYQVCFEKSETLNSITVENGLLGEKTVPVLENGKCLALDEKYFVIDALIFKDVKSRSVILKSKDRKRNIRVDFPDDANLLIWHKPGAPFICIEPWSGLPDRDINPPREISEKEAIIRLGKAAEYKHTHSITLYKDETPE